MSDLCFFISHVTRATTREDPRSEADQATHVKMVNISSCLNLI